MDLNNIVLPMATLTYLYRDSLVIPGQPGKGISSAENDVAQMPVPWPHLGGNNKNILIVVDHEGITHLPDTELTFLVRMLPPCKLSLDDVAIINKNNYRQTDHKKLIGHFNSQKVLLFGFTPIEFGLPVQFPEFQVQAFQKVEYVQGPSLSLIEKEETLKRKCWESLKKIFNL